MSATRPGFPDYYKEVGGADIYLGSGRFVKLMNGGAFNYSYAQISPSDSGYTHRLGRP